MKKKPEACVSSNVVNYFREATKETQVDTVSYWVFNNLHHTRGIEHKQDKLVELVALLTQELLNNRPDLFSSVMNILDTDSEMSTPDRDMKLIFPDS